MFRKLNRQLGFVLLLACSLSHPASAIESPNVIMGIDGMAISHAGLFRNASPNDGFNTFRFGPMASAAGSLGRYKSFYFIQTAPGSAGLITYGRTISSSPEHWTGSEYQPAAPLDIGSDYFPVIDRAAFGALFDPDDYQIEVKFKPNQTQGLPPNQAAAFDVNLDQIDGFVFDAEAGIHKRAAEQFIYRIGSDAVPINTWYASAPKDADGFATWTVPITAPSFAQRSFYYAFGSNDFRTEHVITGGGRAQNPDGSWSDVIDGPDFDQFGSPLSSLNAPNGLGSIGLGSAPDGLGNLSIDVKSITVAKINPGPIVSRIDANSGITHRFGSGFTRSTSAPPIPVPNDPFGLGYLPRATDQISRFDQNGMTNLTFNMRISDNPSEVHRFLLRDAPGPNSFDGTTATVNIRAKLLASNTASSLTVVAKDLDGNDNAGNPIGADEYTYNLDLSQFNTSTFTTVAIPLSDFTLSTFIPGPPSTGPFGFNNLGDGSLTAFNLYEFGGLVPAGGGLLRLEVEFMEIRLIPEPSAAVLMVALCAAAICRRP
jgi:hypothetical protein